MFRRLRAKRSLVSGQTGTEYMLVISVIVIAVVGAAYGFVPSFRAGVEGLAFDVVDGLKRGYIRNVGADRGAVNATDEAQDPPAGGPLPADEPA